MTPDLTGRRFGKMEIIGPAGPEHGPLPPTPTGWWVGRCQCGREMVAPAEGFLSRRITSCGRPSPEDTAAEAERLAARRPPLRI
jgi:hypothetical protein